MNKTEISELLVFASAVDNRNISTAMVDVWHDLIGDIEYSDALAALKDHRRNNPGVYFEPGHVVSGVRKARARFVEIYGIHPAPPAGKRWAVDVIESLREIES